MLMLRLLIADVAVKIEKYVLPAHILCKSKPRIPYSDTGVYIMHKVVGIFFIVFWANLRNARGKRKLPTILEQNFIFRPDLSSCDKPHLDKTVASYNYLYYNKLNNK